jgi:hypothetical protein
MPKCIANIDNYLSFVLCKKEVEIGDIIYSRVDSTCTDICVNCLKKLIELQEKGND